MDSGLLPTLPCKGMVGSGAGFARRWRFTHENRLDTIPPALAGERSGCSRCWGAIHGNRAGRASYGPDPIFAINPGLLRRRAMAAQRGGIGSENCYSATRKGLRV
jgi:hypothetical protein